MDDVLLGSERDRPLHFAGRQQELAALGSRLAYIQSTGDARGGVVLVDGLQGIGKSQLLREFVERSGRQDDRVLHTAFVADELPADAKTMFAALTDQLERPPVRGNRVAALLDRVSELRLGVAKVTVGVGFAKELTGLLRESADAGWWAGRALIVTIDEVQNIGDARRRVLRTLHEGLHQCPIMVVCAGLQHAAKRLADASRDHTGVISRFAKHITLAPLSKTEAREAIARSVELAGGAISPANLARLADASIGFPQHVHGYVAGALQALRVHGETQSQRSLALALEVGDRQKIDYYQGRLSSMRRPSVMLDLARAMADQMRHSLARDEAERVIAERTGNGTDASAIVDDAIAKGVLTESFLGEVSFGIPSLQSFIVDMQRQRDSLAQAQAT